VLPPVTVEICRPGEMADGEDGGEREETEIKKLLTRGVYYI
jgi:hypothetical protein